MNARLFLPVLVVAATLATTNASAQSAMLMADVPFEFRVGNKVLPAGEYTLIGQGSSGAVLVRGEGPGAQTYTITQACGGGDAVKEGKLVFHRAGNHYFLRQIWTPGYSQGREIGRSALEREIARHTGFEVASVRAWVK
jgi:hypothetical protein